MSMDVDPVPARSCNMLIVDDDPTQARLFEKQLHELGVKHRCFHAPGGAEALDFLRRSPSFQNAPRPDLIILDLKMPGMDGGRVLREIKSDEDLRRIPVIVLSGWGSDEDFTRCYEEAANACIRKPRDYEGSLRVVREIERFWCHVAALA